MGISTEFFHLQNLQSHPSSTRVPHVFHTCSTTHFRNTKRNGSVLLDSHYGTSHVHHDPLELESPGYSNEIDLYGIPIMYRSFLCTPTPKFYSLSHAHPIKKVVVSLGYRDTRFFGPTLELFSCFTSAPFFVTGFAYVQDLRPDHFASWQKLPSSPMRPCLWVPPSKGIWIIMNWLLSTKKGNTLNHCRRYLKYSKIMNLLIDWGKLLLHI